LAPLPCNESHDNVSTQTDSTVDASKPWYRQFWPWFLIALPATSVVAGLTTLAIAIRNQDSLVRDDWYKDGKAINQSLARDAEAYPTRDVCRTSDGCHDR
jgi:hypothetical protein